MVGDNSGGVWMWGWLAIMAAVVVLGLVSDFQRRRNFLSLIQRERLELLKDLPATLTLADTELAGGMLQRGARGIYNGTEVVIFDCRIGQGKGSWSRTVIAARSPEMVFGAEVFDPDLRIGRAGEWLLLYRPKEFFRIRAGWMSVAEIEAQLKSIGLPDATTVETSDATLG